MTKHVDPAIKSYFFGKGYRDLGNVIKECWERNRTSAKFFFGKIDKSGEWWKQLFSHILFGGAGISVILFGTIFFVALSTLHIILLGFFFLLIYIGFSIVWVSESILLLTHSFFATCPVCHKRTLIPEYLCDKCGKIHTRLIPNSYGILFHTCTCGNKLPASFFVNRGRLQARCPAPSCHSFLDRKHVETQKICIPILGGPSSGKTTYIFSLVRRLIEQTAPMLNFETGFLNKTEESAYKKVENLLKHGTVPEKTTNILPRAFNLELRKHGKIKWLLYLYDPAGEAYINASDQSEHHYHEYLNGMILILDPFSIPKVRSLYENELSRTWNSVKPSSLPVDETLETVISTLENSYGLSKTGRIKSPLAVVITKIDAFGLENIIGEQAVIKASIGGSLQARSECRNNLLINQLKKWGQESLIQLLETRFTEVAYFSCSSLGRIPDGSQKDFISYDVMEPLLWICGNVSPKDFNPNSV